MTVELTGPDALLFVVGEVPCEPEGEVTGLVELPGEFEAVGVAEVSTVGPGVIIGVEV